MAISKIFAGRKLNVPGGWYEPVRPRFENYKDNTGHNFIDNEKKIKYHVVKEVKYYLESQEDGLLIPATQEMIDKLEQE